MGKIYCVNTVDGHNIYGRQFVNLKSGQYGCFTCTIVLYKLYCMVIVHILEFKMCLSHCSYCIGCCREQESLLPVNSLATLGPSNSLSEDGEEMVKIFTTH